MYPSLKTYYFGVFSTLISLLVCAYVDPQLFALWKIGTPEYPLHLDSFLGCLVIGIFSWTSQDSMTLALEYAKSGTVAGFYNVAMILSFLTDSFYFHREIICSDYIGGVIIIISTSLQGYISNQDNKEEQLKQTKMLAATAGTGSES